ncbi:MAG: hypothetical protein HQK92_09675 [Nitrospirae bacterium]|nr:hypothetical protein [Nitrospirota bacterium]
MAFIKTAKKDFTYNEYITTINKIVSKEGITLVKIRKSDRYPGRHEGTTIISDPREPDHKLVYDYIKKKQQLISNIDKKVLMPTPRNSFHLTLLGITYEALHEKLLSEGRIDDAVKCVKSIIKTFKPIGFAPKMRIAGFTPFKDAIVAIMKPVDERSYQALIDARKTIVDNKCISLFEMGLKSKAPAVFHITTHYFVHDMDEVVRESLNAKLADMNSQLDLDSPTMNLSYFIYTEFHSLKRFKRMEGSSVLRFESEIL